MHDSAHAFAVDRDAIVIDNPEDPPTARQLAEEVVPHIIITSGDGRRHKLTPDRTSASCGMEYHAAFDSLVPESLGGDLCQRGCFPQFELDKAAGDIAKERHAIENMPTPSQWLDTQEVLAAARIDRNKKRKK